MNLEELKHYIWDVPDFPQAGILYRDITPLLAHPPALRYTLDCLKELAPAHVSHVAAIESRGFLFGPAIAAALQVGFVPIRKPNKLPRQTKDISYTLEYGEDKLSVHSDALGAEDTVYLVDDLIATGGTLAAAIHLIQSCGARLAKAACVIELTDLKGRAALGDTNFSSLVRY